MTQSRTVLVVDDEQDTANMLGLLLSGVGFRVLVCYSGLTALDTARRECPDAAIVDLAMPGLDGIGLAHALRALAWTPPIRLVALSGYASVKDQKDALDAGFDCFLAKPTSLDHLLDALEQR